MPKYLFTGSFTQQGGKGLQSEGGTARVKAVSDLMASLGGALESYYFAFGGDDYVIVAELPDLELEDVAEALRYAAEAVRERALPVQRPA